MIIDGESIYSGCKIYIVTNYNQGYRKAGSSDRLGSSFRPEYEYMIGYFYDLNYILEIEKRLETNNVKFIKKYR